MDGKREREGREWEKEKKRKREKKDFEEEGVKERGIVGKRDRGRERIE